MRLFAIGDVAVARAPGVAYTHKDQLNADLLAFLETWDRFTGVVLGIADTGDRTGRPSNKPLRRTGRKQRTANPEPRPISGAAASSWACFSLLRSLRRKGWIGAILLMPLAIIEQIGGTVRGSQIVALSGRLDFQRAVEQAARTGSICESVDR